MSTIRKKFSSGILRKLTSNDPKAQRALQLSSKKKKQITEKKDVTSTKPKVNEEQLQDKLSLNKKFISQYKKTHPFASDWTGQAIVNFEHNGKATSYNGRIYYPDSYVDPNQAYFEPNSKTDKEIRLGHQRFKQQWQKEKELKDLAQTAEIINNPYNPIGWIPGLRTMVNAGADQRYSRLTGKTWTPYAAGTFTSAATDAVLGPMGPLKSYVGSYAGTVAGGQIGKQLGYENEGQIVGGILGGSSPFLFPKLYNSIASRFTPYGFRFRNNYYNLSYTPQGTLSTGGLGELSGIRLNKTPIQQSLPGFQIKSLMQGSPLEKQLSKNGTLSLKQLQAYIGRNDVSAIDKELLNRVLQNHTGETHINYNILRKEVQEMIPKYNRVPQTSYQTYGVDKLGYNTRTINEKNLSGASLDDSLQYNTFTFESPYINGNDDHFDYGTLGHSRTFTKTNEPNILYVMESQSDWAQWHTPFKPRFRYNRAENGNTNVMFDQNGKFYYVPEGTGMPYKQFMDTSLPNDQFPFGLAQTQYKQLATANVEKLVPYMQKSYLQRQLQENLRYAAENGQTKMRYPTPETAAKIEGYVKKYNQEYYDLKNQIKLLEENDFRPFSENPFGLPDEINLNTGEEIRYTSTERQLKLKELEDRLQQLISSGKHQSYPSHHQTILKKYADFPKQFQKLFGKQAEVRIVEDSKGNTWYEVDVPQSYLDGTAEMLFKKGGVINQFKNRNNIKLIKYGKSK